MEPPLPVLAMLQRNAAPVRVSNCCSPLIDDTEAYLRVSEVRRGAEPLKPPPVRRFGRPPTTACCRVGVEDAT